MKNNKTENQTDALKAAIIALENQSVEEFVVLQKQFSVSLELFKPINLIKSAISEVTSSPDMKDAVVNNLVGLTAGFFTKKLFEGNSTNPLIQKFGTIIQLVTENVVSNHVDDVRTIGCNLVRCFLKRRDFKNQHIE